MRLNTISISSSHDGHAQFHVAVFSALYYAFAPGYTYTCSARTVCTG